VNFPSSSKTISLQVGGSFAAHSGASARNPITRSLQRSASARADFMKQTGYPKGRKGYVVDHIIPLGCGGTFYSCKHAVADGQGSENQGSNGKKLPAGVSFRQACVRAHRISWPSKLARDWSAYTGRPQDCLRPGVVLHPCLLP